VILLLFVHIFLTGGWLVRGEGFVNGICHDGSKERNYGIVIAKKGACTALGLSTIARVYTSF
jgi:hypothetical protein